MKVAVTRLRLEPIPRGCQKILSFDWAIVFTRTGRVELRVNYEVKRNVENRSRGIIVLPWTTVNKILVSGSSVENYDRGFTVVNTLLTQA